MSKQICSAFTMARNEPLWLNVWLSHNSAELGEENCHVICEPDDPTVDVVRQLFPNAHFHVEPSPKPGVQGAGFYDGMLEQWRLSIVRRWQAKLLVTHDCVIFGDTDELLMPEHGIVNYCKDVFIPSGADHVRSVCWQPVQQDDEPAVRRIPGAKVLASRTKMWLLPTYDKTLLVRTPQWYSKGFHLTYGKNGTGKSLANGLRARHEEPVDHRLPMIHCWRIDFDDWYQDGQWRYNVTQEEGREYFATHESPKIVGTNGAHAVGPAAVVPNDWKQRLVFR